ncbi:putative acetyl-CoA-benzylalcohol acetyltransferase-like [Capsicum annuum]|nr:putative acetyl-CoA-benzylalcohol acetyltransferase-like [Capsicum annuum]
MLKPSTPTPNHLRSLKLSLFDQLVPPLFYTHQYSSNYLPSNEEGIITERRDELQKSLAETLTKFYPLAGRFSENHIHCNDGGVEYVKAKVNADLAEFLHQGAPKNTEFLNDLLPWCVVPPGYGLPSNPLLGIQVNIFNCGVVVIAIQMSHIIADGFTIATVANELAHICQKGTTKDCLSSFGQFPSLFPTRVLSGALYPPPPNNGVKIVTRRFLFDASAIAKLQDTIDSSATSMRPTRVVAVMSLIWKALVGINGHSRDSSLFCVNNLRGKTNLPFLEHALGNCVIFGVVNLEASQSRKEFNEIVNLVGNTIRDISAGVGKASVDDILSFVVNKLTKVEDKYHQGDERDIYMCTSWCRFPWYEADFGWGK